jgi:anti-sigma factor RsiW
MTCRDVDDLIEAVVGGDAPASEAFHSHVEGCVRCAAAVAAARQIELTLAARPVETAPINFAATVIARIRRERWQSEQHVDRLFNTVLVAGVAMVIGGVLALLNLSGLTGTIGAGVALMNQLGSRLIVEAAPSVSTYLLSAAFFLTALIVWWWAERRLWL